MATPSSDEPNATGPKGRMEPTPLSKLAIGGDSFRDFKVLDNGHLR